MKELHTIAGTAAHTARGGSEEDMARKTSSSGQLCMQPRRGQTEDNNWEKEDDQENKLSRRDHGYDHRAYIPVVQDLGTPPRKPSLSCSEIHRKTASSKLPSFRNLACPDCPDECRCLPAAMLDGPSLPRTTCYSVRPYLSFHFNWPRSCGSWWG